MELETESERLFRAYCRTNRIPCRRVPTKGARGEKSPDFLIRPSGRTIVVEVKELDEAPLDRILSARLLALGSTGAVDPGLDKRVRNKITKAMPQLRALAKGKHPAVLVLYQKTGLFPTGGLEIRLGMYGSDIVDVGTAGPPTRRTFWFRHRFGPGQKVAPTHNTTLSAIALIHQDAAQTVRLAVYHNRHAQRPLIAQWLSNQATTHYRLRTTPGEGGLIEWEEY